jgi:hypothetical protein
MRPDAGNDPDQDRPPGHALFQEQVAGAPDLTARYTGPERSTALHYRLKTGRFAGCVIAACTLALSAGTAAESEIRSERVQFPAGASGTAIEDSVTGYEIVDYVLGAAEGQSMTLELETDNLSSYFNVLPPGEDAVAIYIGSVEGNRYQGVLPASGDYRVRVYLMRNAARRNETANYAIAVAITSADAEAAAEPGAE